MQKSVAEQSGLFTDRQHPPRCSEVQNSAVQYSAVCCSAKQFHKEQVNTVQTGVVQCRVVWRSAAQRSTRNCSVLQRNSIIYVLGRRQPGGWSIYAGPAIAAPELPWPPALPFCLCFCLYSLSSPLVFHILPLLHFFLLSTSYPIYFPSLHSLPLTLCFPSLPPILQFLPLGMEWREQGY